MLTDEIKSNLHLLLLKQAQGDGFIIPWMYGGNSQKIVEGILAIVSADAAFEKGKTEERERILLMIRLVDYGVGRGSGRITKQDLQSLKE